MDIKYILDKIILESDVRKDRYTVANRIDDVNEEYMFLIEWATQMSSHQLHSDETTRYQIINITADADELVELRDNIDTTAVRVEFKASGASEWQCLDWKEHCEGECCSCGCLGDMRFEIDEKKIFLYNTRVGEIRITYDRGFITKFVESDYTSATPPEPKYLPEVFRPLLWMRPAIRRSGYYKPERYQQITNEYNELFQLFKTHYSRNASYVGKFVAGGKRSKL